MATSAARATIGVMPEAASDDLDVEAVVRSIRLDQLTVTVSQVLHTAGIPHALLKGPTTARWLYDPPRPYNDIDVLIPDSRLSAAVRVLEREGVGRRVGGRPGEAAAHSQLLRTAEGAEVDLHFSLPMLDRRGGDDSTWSALSRHIVPFSLDRGSVPALDAAGRCLVLCLHALNSFESPQAVEDLRRARLMASRQDWITARLLSEEIGGGTLFDGGLHVIGQAAAATLTPGVLAWLSGDRATLAVLRWRQLSWPERAKRSAAKMFPSLAFLQENDPRRPHTVHELAAAYVRRLVKIARHLPRALRASR